MDGEKYGDTFEKPFISYESGADYASQFVKGGGFQNSGEAQRADNIHSFVKLSPTSTVSLFTPPKAAGEKVYSLSVGVLFQEEEPCIRLRSWQVNAGGAELP